MRIDSFTMIGDATANNLTIIQGDALPIEGNNLGELFYLTGQNNGLFVFTGEEWQKIQMGADTAPNRDKIIGSLENQSDLQSILDTKAEINNPTFTGTVSGITKVMVGLGNVDNTSDSNKPISSATQNALNGKVSLTDVQAYFDLKADLTYVNNSLGLKANLTYVNDALALKADTTALNSGLLLKADITTVNSALDLKADKTTVNADLALKATIVALNDGLALKANTSTMNTALALKADKTALATKAETAALTDGLALKADLSAVNTSLSLKANSSTVNSALALKADISFVNSQLSNYITLSDSASALALKADASTAVTLTGAQTLENKIFKGVQETGPSSTNIGSTYAVNMSEGSLFRITLTVNSTFTFPAPVFGKQFTLFITQSSSGSKTISWPANVRWPANRAPAITAMKDRTDIISFIADENYWVGIVSGLNYRDI